MGISGLWMFLRKGGYRTTVAHASAVKSLPHGSMYRIDLAGTLYPQVQGVCRNPGSMAANKAVEQQLARRGFQKDSTAIYIDGPPPAEKVIARELREQRRCSNTLPIKTPFLLRTASRDVQKLENMFGKNVNRSKKGQSLARYLESKGWCAIACPSEADIAIGDACRKDDIVVTPDSDAFAYAKIYTIWRPQGDHYLVYDVLKVLQHLGLSRVALTTFAVICSNDYTDRVLGMKTNLRILQSLEKDVLFPNADAMMSAYLDFLSHIGKGVPKGNFNPALDIFVRLRFTPWFPHVREQVDSTTTRMSIQRPSALQHELEKGKESKSQSIRSV